MSSVFPTAVIVLFIVCFIFGYFIGATISTVAHEKNRVNTCNYIKDMLANP